MNLFLTRAINLIKIIASYLISRLTKRVIHWGKPLAASIEPSNYCNLRCPECPAGFMELTRPHGYLTQDLFQSVLNQLLPQISYLTLYFQGEPYLSNQLFEFISFARSKKIFVATSTNGHFLDYYHVNRTIESGLNRLIISLDGADQQTYAAYRRGGDFEKVIAGIRLMTSEKKRLKKRTPEIILQCLVLRSNEHHLDDIRRLAKELGVDKLEFKTAQFYDHKNGNPLMPENQKYSRYKRIDGDKIQNKNNRTSSFFPWLSRPPGHPATSSPFQQFVPKNRMPDACFRMWSSCVITWDGKVVPCCFDKDATHSIGELTNQSFNEIWRGETACEFRGKILQNRKSVDICSNCSQTF